MTTYLRPDLNDMSLTIGIEDLLRAATLLRYAETPTGARDRALILRVASICATRGVGEAIMWLDGYWYVTGVRNHEIVTGIQQILTLQPPKKKKKEATK